MIRKYSFLFITTFFLLIVDSSFGQEAFKYQAVIRDSSGAVLPNQVIRLNAGIVQIEMNLPPVYEEEHTVTSNAYGVVNIEVGNGEVIDGDFETIDWSQKSFLKMDIDIYGGYDYDLNSISEILSVPKALYAERAGRIEGNGFGLLVTDFGAKGDGETDDTEAFKLALDSAFIVGAKVLVPHGIYKITETLSIKDGVSMIGEGTGSDPLETPYNGSLIYYYGTGFAIKVIGHSVKLRDLVIRDKSGEQSKGGILVQAKNRLVENIHFEQLLISGFTNGTGLKLHAKNGGGLYYSSFNNVRVRHGKIGIQILQDSTSYVNSNSWNNCQVSGGGFKYGVLVEGGNNNNITGLVIEPYSTTHGHFVLKKGHIYGTQMRIEGIHQDESVPIILFAKNTKNSILTGIYGGGLTLDKGNNFINMTSGKAIHYKNSSVNQFRNASFFSPDGEHLADWDLIGDYNKLEILEPELSENHNVLKITVSAGDQLRIEPTVTARPQIKALPLYDQVNFGFYVKTDVPEFVHTFTNSPNGWTRSTCHSGSDEWEFVGMNAEVDRAQQSRFVLQITNPTAQDQIVFVSLPTLNFGNQLPVLDEQPISSSGGQLYGLLIHALANSEIPSNGFLDLPRTANYFEITGTIPIYRINHLTANRFPKGSVITLLFKNAGIGVTKSGYLILKVGFVSTENSSLTLISNGNGTWTEVNRNE